MISMVGGDALRGRQLADSPISHYNSWVRVPTPSAADRGSVSTPTALMETWDERVRPDVVQPNSETTTSVFDGGETIFTRHLPPLHLTIVQLKHEPTSYVWTT